MTITILQLKPGIQRDGTRLDSDKYVDGQWVRFRRGKPKKMGGYRRITANVNGPVYGTHVWSRQGTNLITLFSGFGIEQVQVNNYFIGATIYDRTPNAWVTDPNCLWQFSTMYDSAAGSQKSLLIAHPGSNLANIDDNTPRDIYYGDADGNAPLVAMGAEWRVSGGSVVAAPYHIAYGSYGQVIWSNQNEPRNALTGDAGSARITDKKIIKGLQIRGTGKSPSVLLWTIDSLIRMSYIGGPPVFQFETVTNQISVLSTNGIIEYDGLFFWAGIDRFMVYNGAAQEVPNNTNIDSFYDNLNFDQRQKVFAIKVPRFGEIWWFYPSHGSTECNRAVIFNVREQIWYDVELARTSGSSAQTVQNPIMVDAEVSSETTCIKITSVNNRFLIGDNIIGQISGATGRVAKVVGNTLYLDNVIGSFRASPSEVITGPNGFASTVSVQKTKQYAVWVHETGLNKIEGDNELSIPSFIETCDFSFLTSGPATAGDSVADTHTRVVWVEPDFLLNGTITMNVVGENSANGLTKESKDYVIDSKVSRINMREQFRIIRMRFTSDCLNGDFEMGKIILNVEPGDQKA